ncbi:unnamed protein product [Penicillium egyptiacum]|uniref:FAD-binding domain-containing protein n=1 Tax=Penicillium egyptiacum TaxID=1303716 RepID=A0A9W4KE64_9EURO|nr:unnamed protein product [Penicillium egyptiacum]
MVSKSDNGAAIEFLDPAGKLYALDFMDGYGLGEGMIIHRGTSGHGLYEHAKSLSVALRFGSAVTGYWEDEDQAVVIVNGEQRIAADCVVGADGVHSKTRDYVPGYRIAPRSSELATFRACFSANLLVGDSEAQSNLEEVGVQDQMRRYITTGELGLTLATGKRGRNVIWQVWHKDTLALLQDRPAYSQVPAVVRHTPSEKPRATRSPLCPPGALEVGASCS